MDILSLAHSTLTTRQTAIRKGDFDVHVPTAQLVMFLWALLLFFLLVDMFGGSCVRKGANSGDPSSVRSEAEVRNSYRMLQGCVVNSMCGAIRME